MLVASVWVMLPASDDPDARLDGPSNVSPSDPLELRATVDLTELSADSLRLEQLEIASTDGESASISFREDGSVRATSPANLTANGNESTENGSEPLEERIAYSLRHTLTVERHVQGGDGVYDPGDGDDRELVFEFELLVRRFDPGSYVVTLSIDVENGRDITLYLSFVVTDTGASTNETNVVPATSPLAVTSGVTDV